jgi:hypothetical protein
MSITYSENVFSAIGIQHEKRMPRIIVTSVAVYISTLSHKRHDFQKKKVIDYETCLIFMDPCIVL